MKTLYLIICILFFTEFVISGTQDSLTLKYCHETAVKNYPLIKQKQLLVESSNLKLKNAGINYLPKIDINAQATYQSDVTQIQLPSPTVDFGPNYPANLPKPTITMHTVDSPAKDQYKISLDISQIIFDGGLTNASKKVEVAGLAADTQKVSVDIYQIKEKINQLFFSILFLQEKDKLTDIIKKELEEKIKSMESGVKNGILLPSIADALKAEIIKTDQQKIEIKYARIASYKMLSELMAEKLSDNISLKLPEFSLTNNNEFSRPEYLFFDLQSKRIEASQILLGKKYSPKLIGFAQLGYGRPGLNMFKTTFDSFYIVGAKLTWNVWDWKQTSRDVQILNLQKDIINTQKETFEKNINVSIQNELANIDKIQELMKMDAELISLRESITKRSASQMQNGVITTTEYISDLNNESMAKLNLFTHKLQLLLAKLNYLTIKGNI